MVIPGFQVPSELSCAPGVLCDLLSKTRHRVALGRGGGTADWGNLGFSMLFRSLLNAMEANTVRDAQK